MEPNKAVLDFQLDKDGNLEIVVRVEGDAKPIPLYGVREVKVNQSIDDLSLINITAIAYKEIDKLRLIFDEEIING